MERGSTLILKLTIWLLGIGVLGLCVVGLPMAITITGPGGYQPILIGMYVPAIPFFIALFQGLKLLKFIDHHQAFTPQSVTALKHIKQCGLIISALYAAGMPYIYYVANKDDAPGVILIGLIIVFASFIIAVAAALFQKLFQNAVEIKTENDLTV